jgi:alanyl-tRNA synthetase
MERDMTRRLYQKNQYVTTFSSAVIERIEVEKTPAIILEQTAFYPTSGGQPHDIGTLNGVQVIDVIENEDHQIIHLLEKPIQESSIEGSINWKRRFDHMQQHTGQHLLSQAFIKTCNAETVSFHLGEEVSTIDVSQAGMDGEMVKAAEDLANQIIYENREVVAHFVNKDAVHKFPVRKVPTVDDNIRILEIKDFDYSPCGGTHCSHTGEIGMIKVRKWEHYKGGTRIQFICGWRALSDYQQKTEILQQLSNTLTSGEAELPQNIEKLQEETKSLRREQAGLTKQLLDYEAKALLTERGKFENFYVLKKIFAGRSPKDLKVLANKVLENSSNTVILFGGKTEGKASLIFLRSEGLPFNMNQLMKTACVIINGRGGGQPHQAQGGSANIEKLEEALQSAKEAIFKEK